MNNGDILSWRFRKVVQNGARQLADAWVGPGSETLVDEPVFKKLLQNERRRTERSGHPFLLMLVDLSKLVEKTDRVNPGEIRGAVASTTRETDITGWYKTGQTVGVIFTTLLEGDRNAIQAAIHPKVVKALYGVLNKSQVTRVEITFHFYPEDAPKEKSSPLGAVPAGPGDSGSDSSSSKMTRGAQSGAGADERL